MKDVIDRMQAADLEDSNAERVHGEQMGEHWAKKDARPRQLRKMEEPKFNPMHDINNAAIEFLQIVANNPEIDRISDAMDDHEHWLAGYGITEETAFDPDFVEGFYNGAQNVWVQVRTEL